MIKIGTYTFVQSYKIYAQLTLINVLLFRLNEAGEIIIKTISDYWIVGKLSNLREFFVIIQQKSASIIEIDGKCNIL